MMVEIARTLSPDNHDEMLHCGPDVFTSAFWKSRLRRVIPFSREEALTSSISGGKQ